MANWTNKATTAVPAGAGWTDILKIDAGEQHVFDSGTVGVVNTDSAQALDFQVFGTLEPGAAIGATQTWALLDITGSPFSVAATTGTKMLPIPAGTLLKGIKVQARGTGGIADAIFWLAGKAVQNPQ